MAGNADDYRGDLKLTVGKKCYRIEVKTRVKLPTYITSGNVKEILNYCSLFGLSDFVDSINGIWHERVDAKIISTKRTKGLINWFEQDDSDIVAMKEKGKSKWYFAVKHKCLPFKEDKK